MFDYLAPADLLEGKSILITGASDGIRLQRLDQGLLVDGGSTRGVDQEGGRLHQQLEPRNLSR